MFAALAQAATGVVYCGSLIKMCDITNGASNTYLVGEKNVCPDHYMDGGDPGDNDGAVDRRERRQPPLGRIGIPSSTPPATGCRRSRIHRARCPIGRSAAHANGFQMAFCDGSVQMMTYAIDLEVHRRLCNRKDGYVIDGKKSF